MVSSINGFGIIVFPRFSYLPLLNEECSSYLGQCDWPCYQQCGLQGDKGTLMVVT